MKLLFDQNISFRVVKGLQNIFPLAKQVRELDLENSTDREIWEYAKSEGQSIITEFIENPEYSQIGCLELNKNIFEA